MATRLRGILLAISLVLLFAYILGISSPTEANTPRANTSMDTSPCPFCVIAESYNASADAVPQDPDPQLINPSCYLILSTDLVLAFLDIMPITSGHVLVVSRPHREKLSDLKSQESAALGFWLPVVSRAVMRALGRDGGDWNVVQNNGATAAQVVPHVHYHIIPRGGKVPDLRAKSWTMFGRGQRDDLDDDEAVKLAAQIRSEILKDLSALEAQDQDVLKMLSKL